MTQVSKTVNFSDLSEQEKEQYINFVMQNNIDFEEDYEEEDRYVARIRIKADASSQITPTKQSHFQSRQKKKNSLANSRKNLESVSSVQSISSKQSLRDFNSQQKENRKTPFVLASQNGAKPTNKIAADYMSFRNKSPVETLSTYETQNENKSLFELMENIDITRDQKKNLVTVKKSSINIRSKSTQPTAKKLDSNSEEAANQKKAASLIDEYLSGCIEEYKTFSKLMDFENTITSSVRPKKLSLDALSKLIEEIWTARFTKETNLLKANLSKGDSTNRSYLSRQRNSSLAYFTYEFLKEKNKGSKNNQMGLSLAYSTLLYRRKSERVNLFSRFLSEQNDNEDLTFFLFGRSLIEKEQVVVLTNNKNLSNDGVGLSQKNCYRILEAIYGKEEKLLINRVFKKVKDQIEWEKEVSVSSEANRINMYSFLKIVLQDYHSSRLSVAADNQAAGESNSTSTHEEITQEEIKDEIEKYLFSQPPVEMPKAALNDITNQTNTQSQEISPSQIQGGLFSNIHSSWYNNPNPSFRNQVYGQFKDTNETVQSDHFNSNYLNTDYSRNNSLASLQSKTNQGRNNPHTVKSLPFNNIEEGDSNYSFEQNETSFSQYEKLNNSKVHNNNSNNNSRSNSYSNLHRKSSSTLDGQQTSYAQLNNRKMNNTRNNSINELQTESSRNGNSSYSSRHNSKQNLLAAKEKSLEENRKSALSLKDKFASISQDPIVVVEKNNEVENFSFRNSDIQQVHNHHATLGNASSDSEHTESSLRYPNFQTNQTENSNSQRSFMRNNNQSQELKSFCLAVMTAKVHDFIDTMLFEGQEEKNEDEQKIMNGLMELFDRKFQDLLEALFNLDKIKWLSSLMIEDPDTKQLQNVEELQKELRSLQRKNFDDLDEGDIEVFANKIFRTPELSTQIGRLIVEFTLPQDLLYEDDSS